MAKVKTEIVDKFIREDYMVTESGHKIEKGDLVKVSGEHGIVFKFKSLTTNPVNNKTWVDCFEMQKGVVGPSRSFYADRIKPVVKRGKRVKRT